MDIYRIYNIILNACLYIYIYILYILYIYICTTYHMWAYAKYVMLWYVFMYIFVWNLCSASHLRTTFNPWVPHVPPSVRKSFTTSEDNSPAGNEIWIQYGTMGGKTSRVRKLDWSKKDWMFSLFCSNICIVCDINTNILRIYVWSKSGCYVLLNILVTKSKTYSSTTATVGWIGFWWFLSLKDRYPHHTKSLSSL